MKNQSNLLSLGEVDLPLGDENGNEEEDCSKNTKLLFPGCCVLLFAGAEEFGLFKKLAEHLFGFELDGRLDNTGNASVTFKLWPDLFSTPVVFPMIEERAAANTEWKFGSDVIALVAAAIVSGGKDDCVGILWLFFCK